MCAPVRVMNLGDERILDFHTIRGTIVQRRRLDVGSTGRMG